MPRGCRYRSIAVLVRTQGPYPRLLDAFDARDVPVQPAGRTGLFAQPEAHMFGKTYGWLVDHTWSEKPFARGEVPTDDEVFDGYHDLYALDDPQDKHVRERLLALKASVASEARPVSLVADFCEPLGDLGVAGWDADDLMASSRLGTLARCSSILADYEAVRRRNRPHRIRGRRCLDSPVWCLGQGAAVGRCGCLRGDRSAGLGAAACQLSHAGRCARACRD